MPADTTDQQITLPVGADLAAVVTAFQNAIADLETRLNLRYADAADRTARHPVGVEGESSDLAAESWADSFDGTAWISRTHRGYRGQKVRDTNAAAINSGTTGAALVNDAVLVVPLEATGEFIWGGQLFYDSNTVADVKMAFTWPGAPTVSRWGAMGRLVTAATSIEASVATASGAALQFSGNGIGTLTWINFYGYLKNTGAAGNLQLQYAQNTADPGNTTIFAGSRLWVMKTK